MPVAAIVSFRLGGHDGVSVVASSWIRALRALGFHTVTVAGEGPVDRLLPGLAIGATVPPVPAALSIALADADLVVVENLCTIPMNVPASDMVADTLRGRPAIMHHHDPPWQRERYEHITRPPYHDPAWRHVTINDLTRHQFEARGMPATTIYNGFDVDVQPGNRMATRRLLGVAPDERLFIHPVRAIARKDIPTAIRMAEVLGGTYWLLGSAEEGYDRELQGLLADARCRVLRGWPGEMADAYAASDVVLFPSTWEGFGNPPIEAALHRKPCVVGPYEVADELLAMGFRWFPSDNPEPLAAFLRRPDQALLGRNQAIARDRFSQRRVCDDLARLIGGMRGVRLEVTRPSRAGLAGATVDG
jgi:glycosyltransferase involved in cell wall biosynthesis